MSDVALVERLVAELIATGRMSLEDIADLERYASEARSGTLWADDLSYLIAFHARILAAVPDEPDDPSADEPDEPSAEEWKKRAYDAMSRAERAETQLKTLEEQLRTQPSGGDAKFDEIKRRFARKYGPDSGNSAGMEQVTRAELFKEFWTEFEEVEKGQ